jgi:hypothetical protein
VWVQEVLKDVGAVRRWVLFIEPVDSWVGRFVRPGLVNVGNIGVQDPEDGFGGVSVGRRLLGWLAG